MIVGVLIVIGCVEFWTCSGAPALVPLGVFKFLTEMFRDPSWFSNEDIQELALVQQEDVQTSQPGFVGTCLRPTQLINDLEQLTTNGSWC